MSPEITGQLAQFAAALTYEKIPEQVREHCKTLLLDALACGVAGHKGEETHQVAAFAESLAQSRESSVIGGGHLSLAGATLLNGYLITGVTMCDVYRPTLTHITPVVVPPALAIAERDDASGRNLLVAIAAGCETATRIGAALNYPQFRARGWHGPGVIGPFGGAAAVGNLLGMDAATMAKAFGLAGSQAAGTYAAWGTPTVKFHQCRGALSGLMAALLAHQQFLAPSNFLTCSDGGLFSSYSDGGTPTIVIEKLGEHWELSQIALRLWPSAATTQGIITAMFDLVSGHSVTLDEIRKVKISMSQFAFDLHGNFPRYRAKFEALLSAHYAAAVILRDKELTLTQFEPSHYDDPNLRQFSANQVEVVVDPQLSGVQAIVNAETKNGTMLSSRCDYPKGAPENPISREQIERKFRTYANNLFPEQRIEEIIKAVVTLENTKSVRRLLETLRVS